ncbi:MAG: DNA polymerase III subunit gamma/tau [Flavobacteriales bacterium]
MSKGFIVSARKYRPDTWESVVGQKSITSTLQNAISGNHLAQAYLFCGPRGVGKTTCARLFAKSINRANGSDTDLDFSFNIFELDAASNNSVEDIRSITDQVRIPPQNGQYKVYIIDEVHMLSQAAFNAFLKTLEEPPPHAVFILATTEKHKIIPTILSRCQIFDFSRITVADMTTHLSNIAQQEGISAEPDALHVIAEKADGALRDALSIFDQIVSFSQGNITYQSVIENLNILDYDYFFRLVDEFNKSSIHQALVIYDEILSKGFDGHNFIVGLGNHFRNLLVCKDAVTLKLLEVGDNIKEKYKTQSELTDTGYLIKALNLIGEADSTFKQAKSQRLHVEILLMKLSTLLQVEEEKKNDRNSVKTSAPAEHSDAKKTEGQSKKESAHPVIEPEPEKTQQTVPVAELSRKSATIQIQSTGSSVRIGAIKTESSISIKTTQVKDDENNESESIEEDLSRKPKDEFSKEVFEKIWNEVAEHFKSMGKESLYSTLHRKTPTVDENNLIKLDIHNRVQEQEINDARAEILGQIREKLNNYALQLETKITENKGDVVYYTDRDKFMKLAEKNPALLNFKEKLDLDFD